MTRAKREDGFTIAELVVVLVVFGALVAITVVSLRGIRSQQAVIDCQTELRQLKAAVAQYRAEYETEAPNVQALSLVGLEDGSIQGWRYIPATGEEEPAFEPARDDCG